MAISGLYGLKENTWADIPVYQIEILSTTNQTNTIQQSAMLVSVKWIPWLAQARCCFVLFLWFKHQIPGTSVTDVLITATVVAIFNFTSWTKASKS